jgi:cobalt-zinc-cadmium efflux system outer membrane protein
LQKFELRIPPEVPGAETPLVRLPGERAAREAAAARIYPPLPPLPEEPVPLPGPNGRAYTLADLQRIAAENSPALRQAASDVEAARGLLIQAGTYPNPMIGYEVGPNNNNTATGTYAYFFDQVIKTGGKLTLGAASAQMGLENAVLALKRARSDLATSVRMNYYNVVVARETVRVNKALSRYTDEIYRLQADMMAGGFAASHEPAALRSQAFLIRLGYRQAIASYVYAWKQLVAAMGLRQLPLSAVEGQVDRLIPYYDYDAVLAHVLRNHTDVLTARNTLRGSRYNLKLAQVTPVPDVEVRADVWKETTVLPLQHYLAATVSIPFPIWDKNRGNIRAAASALVRAAEGPHLVEVSLTSGLAAAYAPYKANLAAVEYYRRNILPDQVRYYRGVFERRKVDPTASFSDLVTAQQTLVADVTAYLGVLGSLWTSVVGVADFLQTDDLYQLGKPLELPPLPDLDALPAWPCPQLSSPPAEACPTPTPVLHAGATTTAAPTVPSTPGQRIDKPTATSAAHPLAQAPDPGQSGGDQDRRLPVLEPPFGASTSVKALQEYGAKFLGVLEPPFGASTSAAVPPVEQPSGRFALDLSRRSSAAGL